MKSIELRIKEGDGRGECILVRGARYFDGRNKAGDVLNEEKGRSAFSALSNNREFKDISFFFDEVIRFHFHALAFFICFVLN